ncbi:NACHT C-terminal alpha/beta 1 domain-containing protein [Nostoc sp.]
MIGLTHQVRNVGAIHELPLPLDAPLRGFPPNQPNLLNAIQSWINEIE